MENEELTVGHIPSSSNLADILTKALPTPHFISLQNCLGVCQPKTGICAEGECKGLHHQPLQPVLRLAKPILSALLFGNETRNRSQK